MAGKKGVLLLNIGSPASYQVDDVKKYLKTFLMDRDVIDIPFIFRWPLVNLLIVPKRAPFSAGNYKKVWMEGEGSPLTVYSQRFADKLQSELGESYSVKVGMRYAEPSIDRALAEFTAAGISEVFIAPMFPQYAEATTGSSVKYTLAQINKNGFKFETTTLPPFYDKESFVVPAVDITRAALKDATVDHYLFSFHGLPESHVRKLCDCLDRSDFDYKACGPNCYRGHCYATAHEIARRLHLAKEQWSISFQSRLGRAEWLKPSTDDAITKVAQDGKKNLAVLCPSFVADCIETLEEIGIGGEELFHERGGENFYLVPCVNDNMNWVQGFARDLKALEGQISVRSVLKGK